MGNAVPFLFGWIFQMGIRLIKRPPCGRSPTVPVATTFDRGTLLAIQGFAAATHNVI